MDDLKKTELEVIRYEKLRHVRVLLTNIRYRNMHEHSSIELNIILKGSAKILCSRNEVQLSAGTVFLLNSYEPHELTAATDEPVQILSTQLSNHFCSEYFPQYHNAELDALVLNNVLKPESLEKVKQYLYSSALAYFREEEAFQLECVGCLSLALHTLFFEVPHTVIDDQEYSARKRKTARIHRLTDYIDKHYKEKVMLSELAEMEGVTNTYLSHFFHDNFNMTFQDYLNRLRLEKALILMRDPRLYLVDICMESGFSDNKYLNRIFIKKFGCNAADYRKSRMHRASAEGSEPVSYSEYLFPQAESLAILEQYLKKNGK